MPRSRFYQQPWPLATLAADELKSLISQHCAGNVRAQTAAIGRITHTGEDDAFVLPRACAARKALLQYAALFIDGGNVRHWLETSDEVCLCPYDASTGAVRNTLTDPELKHYWFMRELLRHRKDYGQTVEERGLQWYQHSMFFPERFLRKHGCVFAFTATHNHFALMSRRGLCNRSAPAVFPIDDSEERAYVLLDTLNSSIACFWMRHEGFPRGGFTAGKWQERFNFNNSAIESIPFIDNERARYSPRLIALALRLQKLRPSAQSTQVLQSEQAVAVARQDYYAVLWEMIAVQEELDWWSYWRHGLCDEDVIANAPVQSLELGQRAFEMVLSREDVSLDIPIEWFREHGIVACPHTPSHWPEEYSKVVERRIDAIKANSRIRLLEQPEYKRRWNVDPWDEQLERALREWLLNRLESYFDFDGRMNDARQPTARLQIAVTSVARLADVARQDAEFMEVGELCRHDPAFDVEKLVAELVEAESVPLLPFLRYKPSGLRKRTEWERTWDLQRREDAGEAVGPISVPPKYASADFLKSDYWRLRGKLDVPKERWISFPHCEGPDGTLAIAWAGYDHLELAQSISAYYVEVQERLGGRGDPRLTPLLACLIELLPWLKQWHNEPNAAFDGLRMGDYFEGFIQEEARQLGKTQDEIKAWQPPARSGRQRRART